MLESHKISRSRGLSGYLPAAGRKGQILQILQNNNYYNYYKNYRYYGIN